MIRFLFENTTNKLIPNDFLTVNINQKNNKKRINHLIQYHYN